MHCICPAHMQVALEHTGAPPERVNFSPHVRCTGGSFGTNNMQVQLYICSWSRVSHARRGLSVGGGLLNHQHRHSTTPSYLATLLTLLCFLRNPAYPNIKPWVTNPSRVPFQNVHVQVNANSKQPTNRIANGACTMCRNYSNFRPS